MGGSRRVTVVAIALLAVAMATTTPASATTGLPTKVSPAGDYVQLSLPAGGGFKLENTTCGPSVSKPTQPLGHDANNRIPATGNPTTAGPLTIPIHHPSIGKCDNPSASLKAKLTWKVVLRHTKTGATGELKIPKGGLTGVSSNGVNVCNYVFAYDGAATLPGTWTNGNPSTLAITAQPISGTSTCFGSFTSHLTVTYAFHDVSNPSAAVTVS